MTRERRSRVTVECPGKPGLYLLAPLPGWDVIGVVSTAERTGALVRNQRTGVYCMANAGVLSSLPQRKVAAALKS